MAPGQGGLPTQDDARSWQAGRRNLLALGVALSLLLLALALLLGWREHRMRGEHAALRAELAAAAIEGRVRDRLAQLALELDRLADLADAADDAPREASTEELRLDAVRELRLVRDDTPGLDVDGRNGLRAQLPPRSGADDLQLLPPQEGAQTLTVVWDGQPGMRVVAAVDPEWFAEPLRGHGLEAGSVVNLIHDSQRLYARSRENPAYLGRHLGGAILFSDTHRARGHGRYDENSVLSGEHRQFVYRRLSGTPLTVVVGTPMRAIAAPAWAFFVLALVAAGLLALLWLWLLRVFAMAHDRQDRLLHALWGTTDQLRDMQALAGLAEFRWDVKSGEMQWSDAAFRLYGRPLSAGQPTAEQAFGYLHPDDVGQARILADALIEGGGPVTTEFRIRRGDGALRWISARAEGVATEGGVVLQGVQQDITPLAVVRERLRLAQSVARIGDWEWDIASGEITWSDTIYGIYGLDPREFRPHADNVFLFVHPDDRDELQGFAKALIETGERCDVEFRIVRPDGEVRSIHAIGLRETAPDGRTIVRSVQQDVTEREEVEQRFQLVARATSDAIYDLDIASGALWWSDSFYALFGYTREAMPPTLQAWEDLVHPDDLARVDASLGAAIEAPGVSEWEEEYRFRRHDGSHAVVVDRGFFVRDDRGRALRMVGGMLDVSEKRRQDADLRLLRRAVESTDNGILIADAREPDQPLVYVNAAFERITGYTAAEVLGRNCRLLQGGDRDQAALQGIRDAVAEGREARAVLRNYRKDGSLFWNELHVAPVHAEDGSMAHFVGTMSDVSHRHHYEQELAHRATHDQLTGLPNRQLLMDRLHQAILNADRYGRQAGVVFIDLDDFKLINDNLDHAAGDEALRVVAERLRKLVRDTDTVGRFGGDEFVIVLTEQTDEDGVGRVIDRVSSALSAPMQIGGIVHTLTPSIGWCRYPDAGRDADTLLKHADMAMYQAKRQGRNRAVAYDPTFDAQASRRLQLVTQLRDALEREEFELVFQPLFDRDGRPVALEGLVRWRHPERGLLPPSEFIAVCEESGLIIELGLRTLREAARHHALLAAAGYGDVRIAVNVSALQFGYAFEDDVAAVMEEFRLPPGILELEITESVIMEYPERAIAAMQRIAALGVCLSVDDFGTGYSSLTYLRRLPIHRLKIDRSFVEDLPDDHEATSICASIIGLAHALGLRTVGEGVETEAQRKWLRTNGCDEVQGYLLARPAPFDEILRLLAAELSGSTA